MVWRCAVKRKWIYWRKDFEDGAAKQEKKKKTTEKIHRCSEGLYAEG